MAVQEQTVGFVVSGAEGCDKISVSASHRSSVSHSFPLLLDKGYKAFHTVFCHLCSKEDDCLKALFIYLL